jgi:hypothetical protein
MLACVGKRMFHETANYGHQSHGIRKKRITVLARTISNLPVKLVYGRQRVPRFNETSLLVKDEGPDPKHVKV